MKSALARLAAMVLLSIAFCTASNVRAAEGSPRFFAPDPPGMPAYTLPDVFTTAGGRKITTADQWRTIRRPEILELFRKHVYGRVPATPYEKRFMVVKEDRTAMGGAATLKQVEIMITAAGKSLTIPLTLFVPNKAAKPVPAFLLICNRSRDDIDPTRAKKSDFWPAEAVIARGYAVAAFFNADVAPDRKDSFQEGIHGLLDGKSIDGKRSADAWGTLAAWAWGASRCMDYLQTDKDIAHDKVAVIGHSRGGKTALWAAAEDERFAMVCSNDSGCGGAALSRRKNAQKETVSKINRAFPHWFNENFKSFNDREDKLPVDQHMLIALIAPRAVCVASAEDDLWADPRGEFLSALHAAPVYRLFGKQGLGSSPNMPAIGAPLHGDGIHYHIREGKHDLTLFDWTCYMDFADRVFGRVEKQITNSIGMKLTLIPSGEFMMGNNESAEETAAFFQKNYRGHWATPLSFADEDPKHPVRITRPFYLGTYDITRGQFRQFVKDTGYITDAEKGAEPGAFGFDVERKAISFSPKYSWRNAGFEQTDEHPVVNVSWNDAVEFCRWLSKKDGVTYRLPTEAEWEFACRAGTTTRYYSGDDLETLAKVANVADAKWRSVFPYNAFTLKASDGYVFTAPVGQFKPNAFGLYDMHGNVYQWCADWYDEYYYRESPVSDPKGPESGHARVLRGGSWNYLPNGARSSDRYRSSPRRRHADAGFRVARTQ
jgi:formylglycine-generating enzyme required for sulfatase activity